MTTTETTMTTEAVLTKLQAELSEVTAQRTQAQREVEASTARMQRLERRISAIQVATTTLAAMPDVEHDKQWLTELTDWRSTLSEELLALPAVSRTSRELGARRNVELSITVIDRGLGVLYETGFSIETLRLGTLMRDAGYVATEQPIGNATAKLPWFGSIPEVEHRIQSIEQRRNAALARLDEALHGDCEAILVAGLSLKALGQRKTRGDGSQYDKFADGRIVEVSPDEGLGTFSS